jgi:hypothetical protein
MKVKVKLICDICKKESFVLVSDTTILGKAAKYAGPDYYEEWICRDCFRKMKEDKDG